MLRKMMMFVFLIISVLTIYLVGELIENVGKVSATKIEGRAGGSLVDNPLYIPEEDWIIDPEYNFIMRYSDNVGYDLAKSVNVTSEKQTLRDSTILRFLGPTGSALVTNVGVYKGEWVNLRINLLGIDKYDEISNTQNNYITIDDKGRYEFLTYHLGGTSDGITAELEYVFEDRKGNIMDIGFFGGANLDSITNPMIQTGIKFDSTTKIHKLTQWSSIDASHPDYYEDTKGFYVSGNKGNRGGFLGYQIKNLKFKIRFGQSFPDIRFASILPGSIGLPVIQPRNQTFNDANFTTPVDIIFEQDIPKWNTSEPLGSYELTVTTTDDLYYEYKDIEIHNFTGQESSSFFDVSKNGNEIKITGKDLSNPNFYDNLYIFSFNYKPKDGMTIPRKELGDDDSYLLSMETDSDIVSTSRINFVDLDIPVTGVQLTPESAAIRIKESLQLQETVFPTDATNKNVLWRSSDSSVALVLINGMVAGLKPGEATITVETEDGGYKASTIVTVFEDGTLAFRDSLDALNFEDIVLSNNDVFLAKRKSEGPILSVLDTRWIKESYSIQVSLGEPLSSLSGMILPDALFFMSYLGESKVLSQERIEVFRHQPKLSQSRETEEVQIEWSAEEGILLKMTSKEMIPGNYSGILNWYVVSGP